MLTNLPVVMDLDLDRKGSASFAYIAAATLAAVVLLLLRAPDVLTSPQMFAENGNVLWLDFHLSGLASLFRPYPDYLISIGRIAAIIGGAFDPASAPRVYMIISLAITAWGAATAAAVAPDPRMGILLAAGLVLVPHPGGEVFGSVLHLMWITAPVLALLLCTPPATTRLHRCNQCLFALVSAFTGPFGIFLAPLASLRFWRYRDTVAAVALVGAIVQLGFVFFYFAPQPGSDDAPLDLAATVLSRSLLPGKAGLIASLLLIIASLLFSAQRPLRAGLLLLALATSLATWVKFRHLSHVLDAPLAGSRYFYVPLVVLFWCAVSLSFSGRRPAAIGLAWLATLVLSYPAGSFVRPPLPDYQWATYAAEIGHRTVVIPIPPPGWSVTVPGPVTDP